MRIRASIILISLYLSIANISFAGQDTVTDVGRYQMYFSPHARADTYLIDTKTGKVWTNIQYTDVEGQPRVWKYQERIDTKEDFTQWLKQQEFIKSEE